MSVVPRSIGRRSERRITQPLYAQAGSTALVEAMFVPQRYEPNYAYPLLALFHARGGDEQQMVRSMPALSWRNYVGLSLRGPEAVNKRGRPEGYGWGPALVRPGPLAPPPPPPPPRAANHRPPPLESL